MGEDAGIDRIGLGELSDCGGKGPHVSWINNDDRQRRFDQGDDQRRFITARRFEYDTKTRSGRQMLHQEGDAAGIIDEGTYCLLPKTGDIESLRTDVNSPRERFLWDDGNVVVTILFQGKRPILANAGSQAQATVRVKILKRPGVKLRDGVQAPRGDRPPGRVFLIRGARPPN